MLAGVRMRVRNGIRSEYPQRRSVQGLLRTYGRTYGRRTLTCGRENNLLTVPRTRRAISTTSWDSPVTIERLADMLNITEPGITGLDAPQRYPRLRAGQRDRIDPYTRRLIYERDGYSCQRCGLSLDMYERPAKQNFAGDQLQLDHIVPWSANGSDRSDNLRTLCDECNSERSNYHDPATRRITGVTACCYWCAHRCDELPEWCEELTDDLPRIAAYCGRCGTTSWVPHETWLL